MDWLDSILINIWLTAVNQFVQWELALGLALLGRLLYTFSFIGQWKLIIPKQSLNIPSSKFLPSSQKRFWLKFSLKEIFYVILGIPFVYGAIFILGYSLLTAGQLLRNKVRPQPHKFLNFLGFVFNPIIYILGLIGFITTLTGHVPLQNELICLLLSGVIYKIMRRKFPKVQSQASYSEFLDQQFWHRIPRFIKVTGLIIALIIPFSLTFLIEQRIVPKSETIMLPMRDGIELRTRVYFPPGWNGNSLPVMLIRTPYNLESLDQLAIGYTMQGEILVTQDLRGTGGSQGLFPVFQSDNTDGVDTVNWIMNQTWCNGKIASTGGSALAINQICYQAENPPGLRAASIYMGTGEMYDYGFYVGGCFRMNLAQNWLPEVNALSATNNQLAVLLSHPTKDSYWQNVSLEMNNRYQNVDVRAVHVGGWADLFDQGTIQDFINYNDSLQPYAQGHQILIMGPWWHGIGDAQPGITFPNYQDTSLASYYESLIFNEYFNNETINWNNTPRVFYYVMGDPSAAGSGSIFNTWKNSSSWPVPEMMYHLWYFDANGTLSPNLPTDSGQLSYLYNPTNPVLNKGGRTLVATYNGVSANGMGDQRLVENRTDILHFTSPVLTSPVEITGDVDATLFINSNCTDTDFTAKLMDVFPNGEELYIGDGILKARYRDGFNQSVLMTPGQTYELNIDLWPTSYFFAPGHQIMVSIASSNYPEYALNPNTGGPVSDTQIGNCTLGNYFVANNSVFCGANGEYSSINFPIIPITS